MSNMESTFGGMIGGVIAGTLIGMVSEPFLTALAGAVRPVVKEMVKGGLIMGAATSDLVDGFHNEWFTLVTEARLELETLASDSPTRK